MIEIVVKGDTIRISHTGLPFGGKFEIFHRTCHPERNEVESKDLRTEYLLSSHDYA